MTQSPYSYIWSNDTGPELINGPSRKSMYVTALYFTMTCMTSVSPTQSSAAFTNNLYLNQKRNLFIFDLPFLLACCMLFIVITFVYLQVGFGNVAAETDNEKVFTICMMIIAGAVSDTFRCRVQFR